MTEPNVRGSDGFAAHNGFLISACRLLKEACLWTHSNAVQSQQTGLSEPLGVTVVLRPAASFYGTFVFSVSVLKSCVAVGVRSEVDMELNPRLICTVLPFISEADRFLYRLGGHASRLRFSCSAAVFLFSNCQFIMLFGPRK